MSKLTREIPIEKIVSRQVTLGQQRRRGFTTKVEDTEFPSISISRETGSGEDEVVTELSKILNWPVYDKNIVEKIATTSELNEKLLHAFDERTRDEFREWIKAVFKNSLIQSDRYIHLLSEVILSIGKCGRSIIIGRGANFILPRGQTLNIRLVAPLQHRACYMADKLSVSYEKAEKMVRFTDNERQAYLQQFFNSSEFDPLNYDLIINTGNVNYKTAAGIILTALCRKFSINLHELRAV